ncbi:NADPH:quinone reductase [Amycolatopsis sp. GM8]|uniref:NADPH:quinone reductase n=1 Tax=Amycolatopsis sp. GM8 TaxID=2896530 RepID=UPI001F420102|nr:NADPH:quinone reductase [Amycolatopsis sp. GM8]
MRAIVYTRDGVLTEVDLPAPEPRAGEVRVRVGVSGVNPADWKNRQRYSGTAAVVPHQDGGGVIDAVGEGVDPGRIGQRVWLWETARQRCGGTAQEFVAVPEANAVEIPDGVSLAAGACLGVPAITAHRCLTCAENGPALLSPGALAGRTILVAGGAGAVGHAAIQLGRWSGATVITTVSTPDKAALASAAGAHTVVNYTTEDAGNLIRDVAPHGVDIIVEVAPHANAALDQEVLAPGGTVAVYSGRVSGPVPVEIGPAMAANARWQFVSVFTINDKAKSSAVEAVTAAVAGGILPVGVEAGLPLHHFPLHRTNDAHEAVEQGAIGKVLVDVA